MPDTNTPPHTPPPFLDPDDILEVISDDDLPLDADSPDDNDNNDGDGDVISFHDAEELLDSLEGVPGEGDPVAQVVFREHTDMVLCSAFDPRGKFVATGGVDETVYVWDIDSGSHVAKLEGKGESFEVVAYNHDGTFLAAGDMNGNILVWRTNGYSSVMATELDDELAWMYWHPMANVIVASSQFGNIYMIKVPGGELKLIDSTFGQKCPCGKILPDGKRLVSGYDNGRLKIIDMKAASTLHSVQLENMITCVDVWKDNNLVICGCSNGDVALISSQTGKLLAMLQLGPSTEDYIEVVAFGKDEHMPIALSMASSGRITTYDLVKQNIRAHIITNFTDKLTQFGWHPFKPYFFVANNDGFVFLYDVRTLSMIDSIITNSKCCLSLTVSTDGNYLVTTSSDSTAKMYKIDNIT